MPDEHKTLEQRIADIEFNLKKLREEIITREQDVPAQLRAISNVLLQAGDGEIRMTTLTWMSVFGVVLKPKLNALWHITQPVLMTLQASTRNRREGIGVTIQIGIICSRNNRVSLSW